MGVALNAGNPQLHAEAALDGELLLELLPEPDVLLGQPNPVAEVHRRGFPSRWFCDVSRSWATSLLRHARHSEKRCITPAFASRNRTHRHHTTWHDGVTLQVTAWAFSVWSQRHVAIGSSSQVGKNNLIDAGVADVVHV